MIVNSRVDIILEVGVNSSDITGAFIDFLKPSGSDGFWVASAVPDSTTIIYEAQVGDIDEIGKWIFQAFIETPDGDRHGEPVERFVNRVIRPEEHLHT